MIDSSAGLLIPERSNIPLLSEARSISEFRSLEGIVAWVEKALERMGFC
jgi:hypothetical protein